MLAAEASALALALELELALLDAGCARSKSVTSPSMFSLGVRISSRDCT